MKKLFSQIDYSLNNENGSPHIETLIGVALSLTVGAVLTSLYKLHIAKELSQVNISEHMGGVKG